MRVLHFVQSIEPLQGGGLGQAALGTHLAMSDICASTLVATCKRGYDDSEHGVFQHGRSGIAAFYYSRRLRQMAAELVRNIDWVHGHGLYVGTNWIFGGEAISQRKKLCYHAHGFFDPWILRRSRFKKRLVRFLFEDKICRKLSMWRALTVKEADQIRAAGMRQPIEVLPNGISLAEIDQSIDAAHTQKFELRLRPRRVLFLGRIHPKKGLDLLIGSWSNLCLKHPDWELVIVGPDEGGYLSQVKNMIRKAGVGDSIQILGSVKGPCKIAAFRSSHLFVLPSYSEGFPMAVVEAAAHGLPSVLTKECNFPELTLQGGAWECEPCLEGFTRALDLALSVDDIERRQRGSNGRALIEAGYTWSHIAKNLHDVCLGLS